MLACSSIARVFLLNKWRDFSVRKLVVGEGDNCNYLNLIIIVSNYLMQKRIVIVIVNAIELSPLIVILINYLKNTIIHHCCDKYTLWSIKNETV